MGTGWSFLLTCRYQKEEEDESISCSEEQEGKNKESEIQEADNQEAENQEAEAKGNKEQTGEKGNVQAEYPQGISAFYEYMAREYGYSLEECDELYYQSMGQQYGQYDQQNGLYGGQSFEHSTSIYTDPNFQQQYDQQFDELYYQQYGLYGGKGSFEHSKNSHADTNFHQQNDQRFDEQQYGDGRQSSIHPKRDTDPNIWYYGQLPDNQYARDTDPNFQ